jgi:prepilin-type N-terminal cleavage/methylation domain-containing protein
MKHTHQAFTLIELLVVIAVIGILSTIVLVTTGGAREDAQDAAVLSQFRSMQGQILRCLNKGKVLYCGPQGSEMDCDGQGGRSDGSPALSGDLFVTTDAAFCGTKDASVPDYSFGTWPDLFDEGAQSGWLYGAFAGSDYRSGKFAFYVHKYANGAVDSGSEPAQVICCTQNGCEMLERTLAEMDYFANNDAQLSQSHFCREKAGLTQGGCPETSETGPCVQGSED